MTGRSNCDEMTVSSSPPKSSPTFASGWPFFCRISIASWYVMRGKGAFTFSSFVVSRSRTLSSSRRVSSTRADDEREELLGEVHVAVEVHERDLGLDHPELGEVAARLRSSRRGTWARSSRPCPNAAAAASM